MPQTWDMPVSGDTPEVACVTKLAPSMESLRTEFRGDDAPADPAAGQVWQDTTNGLRKCWDGSSWVVIGPLDANGARKELVFFQNVYPFGIDRGSDTYRFYVPMPSSAYVVESIVLISDVAVSGAANVLEFMLRNATGAADLFSATPDTDTGTVGGVGGGNITADAPYTLAVDQNAVIAASDSLYFEIVTAAGTVNLTNLVLQLNWYPRAAA